LLFQQIGRINKMKNKLFILSLLFATSTALAAPTVNIGNAVTSNVLVTAGTITAANVAQPVVISLGLLQLGVLIRNQSVNNDYMCLSSSSSVTYVANPVAPANHCPNGFQLESGYGVTISNNNSNPLYIVGPTAGDPFGIIAQ
jgi:hypothetical protein